MASMTVMKMIGTLIFSFIIGLITFYMVEAGPKKVKKQQMEEVISMVIQFIIYVWAGKIIVNVTTFMSDPLAVLAHPGDSKAFYVATILTLLHLAYKVKKGTMDVPVFINTFVPILLFTSFMYEFLQIITGETKFHLYFIWVMLLAVGYIGLDNREQKSFLAYYLLMTWLGGVLVLSLSKGYLTMFGFLLPSYYFFFSLLLSIWAFWKVKRGSRKA